MRVLIAEDDAVSRRVLQGMLDKWGYETIVTHDGCEAWEVLRRHDGPGLAILDWTMPGVDGLELCRRVRKLADRGYVYVILLTARGGRADRIEGLEGGADDYLVKPIDMGELRARLRAAHRILDLQTRLLAGREALRQEATHDAMTGLWNRSAVLDALQRELARARRTGAPVGVLLGDLDHFKRVNDTFGHDTGDQALRQTAKRMESAIRVYDTLGRYGGEEFLIVAPGCDAAAAGLLAERIRRCIEAQPIPAGPEAIALTISIGVTACDPVARMGEAGAAESLDLIQAADQAMYRAKHAGSNCVRIAAILPAAAPCETPLLR